MEKNERIIYLDYIKALGLFCVILAHVNAPGWLLQLRSFDVPLLVFVSGYLASKTTLSLSNIQYYKKRFFRLVVPSWIFLCVFFLIVSLFYKSPKVEEIVKGVFFQRDADMVGMLWIIWVYFACALLIPLIKQIKGSKYCFWGILLALIFYELLCCFTDLYEYRIIYMTIFTFIPWGIITYFGFYYDSFTRKTKTSLFITFGILFVLIAVAHYFVDNRFVYTYEYKYPPHLYYFSYACLISVVIFELFRKLKLPNNRIINFVSSSSLWIYLWHILILYVVKSFIENDAYWYIQYFLIIIGSCIVTYVQNRIIKLLVKKKGLSFLKVFLG